MDPVEVMDLFEGLNGPEQMEAANNSGQEQDAPDSGHHTSVQTSSSVASCANTVTVQGERSLAVPRGGVSWLAWIPLITGLSLYSLLET